MLIKNGVIHTMDGPVIGRGYVWVEGSRIAGVGAMDTLPPEDRFGPAGDAQGGQAPPGLPEPWALRGRMSTRSLPPAPPSCGLWTGSTPWTKPLRRPGGPG